jgi:hypothetical protein
MALRIDSYSFGRMTIGGRDFTSDLIIFPDGRIQGSWWRMRGHRLAAADIVKVIEAAPQKVIIGTGANGLMRVSENLLATCKRRAIDVEAVDTGAAVARFNEAIQAGTSVAACFHLGC